MLYSHQTYYTKVKHPFYFDMGMDSDLYPRTYLYIETERQNFMETLNKIKWWPVGKFVQLIKLQSLKKIHVLKGMHILLRKT